MFAQRAKIFAKLPKPSNPHGYCSNAKKDGEKSDFTRLFTVFIVDYFPTDMAKFQWSV